MRINPSSPFPARVKPDVPDKEEEEQPSPISAPRKNPFNHLVLHLVLFAVGGILTFFYNESLKESRNVKVPVPVKIPPEGNAEEARTLQLYASNPMIKKMGWKPFHGPVSEGRTETARHLLDAGVELDSTGETEWLAIHKAAKRGHFEIVKLLLSHGKKALSKNKEGQTPADLAGQYGHKELAAFLKEQEIKETVSMPPPP